MTQSTLLVLATTLMLFPGGALAQVKHYPLANLLKRLYAQIPAEGRRTRRIEHRFTNHAQGTRIELPQACTFVRALRPLRVASYRPQFVEARGLATRYSESVCLALPSFEDFTSLIDSTPPKQPALAHTTFEQ